MVKELLDPLLKSPYNQSSFYLVRDAMVTTVEQIANTFGLSEPDLFQQAVLSFLREKKRQVLHARLDVLKRYYAYKHCTSSGLWFWIDSVLFSDVED